MDNKVFTELTDEERGLIAETLKQVIEDLIRITDEHSKDLAKKLEEVDGEKWKNYCETTKE